MTDVVDFVALAIFTCSLIRSLACLNPPPAPHTRTAVSWTGDKKDHHNAVTWADVVMNVIIKNQRATLAVPLNACKSLTNAASVNGGVVVVERSNAVAWLGLASNANDCSFSDKVKYAVAAGAKGVLIVNNDREMATDLGGGSDSDDIPVLMIAQAPGQRLVRALRLPQITSRPRISFTRTFKCTRHGTGP